MDQKPPLPALAEHPDDASANLHLIMFPIILTFIMSWMAIAEIVMHGQQKIQTYEVWCMLSMKNNFFTGSVIDLE